MVPLTQFIIYCDVRIFAAVFRFEDVVMKLIFVNSGCLFSLLFEGRYIFEGGIAFAASFPRMLDCRDPLVVNSKRHHWFFMVIHIIESSANKRTVD